MGKNKLKKFEDMRSWPHVFEFAQYSYAACDCHLKGRWQEEVFGNDHPIVLELGCGKGEYAVGLAERYPDKNFIGIDIKGARMWTGASQAKEKALKNVVFLRTCIEFLSSFFAENEVSEIWLTFPDPQMKKTRKRLTSVRFMQSYQKLLRPQGCIHLKTDSRFLFSYTSEMIKANALPIAYRTEDLYRDGLVGVPNIQTFYEKQWLQRGLSIKYIRFSIPPLVAWQEPEVDIEPDEYRSFGRSARMLENDVDPAETNL